MYFVVLSIIVMGTNLWRDTPGSRAGIVSTLNVNRSTSPAFRIWHRMTRRHTQWHSFQPAGEINLINDQLFTCLYGDVDSFQPSELLLDPYYWYCRYLTEKLLGSWDQVYRIVIGVSKQAATSSSSNGAILTTLLCAIIGEFKRQNLALPEIVDELYNRHLLRYTDQERTDANQLVFTIIGWLSKS
jgi:hypothetical protein